MTIGGMPSHARLLISMGGNPVTAGAVTDARGVAQVMIAIPHDQPPGAIVIRAAPECPGSGPEAALAVTIHADEGTLPKPSSSL